MTKAPHRRDVDHDLAGELAGQGSAGTVAPCPWRAATIET